MQHGKEHTVAVDRILLASGKAPNLNLDLERAGVKVNKNGIIVNRFLQTTNGHIYAAGDVVGPHRLTHTAEYQSQLAVYNAFHKSKMKVNYTGIPYCVFIEPEIASVGLSEAEADDLQI